MDLAAGYWKMYSVVIQLGAILSVPLLFWEQIMGFVRTFPRGKGGQGVWWQHPLSLVMLGFLVTAPLCYLGKHFIGKNLENLSMMAWALVVGGVVMWVVDAVCRRPTVESVEKMGPLDAVWIGAVQVLSAVFPGTSRSMSTIAAGQVFGLSRTTALEYSFLLSIPTMLAATGYEFLQALRHRPKTPEAILAYGAPSGQWVVLAIGFVVSFLVAWLINKWFINWVRRRGFAPFAVYRIVLGAGLLGWLFMGSR